MTDGTGATLDCPTMRANYDPATGTLQQCYQQYTYTQSGQIGSVEDANGNLTTYEYDGFDRLYRTRFPDKATPGASSTTDYEEYTYDANGSQLTKRARDARVIAFAYDNLGRLLDRMVPGNYTHTANGRTVTHDFTYDLAGRRIRAFHDGIALTYVYDAAGRALSQDNAGYTVARAYDQAGNVTRLTHPDGVAVDFTYDALSRPTTVKYGSRVLASVAYDALSRRQSVTYDNGTSAQYGYTARGDLTCHDWNLTGAAPSACNVAGAEIAYDFTFNGVGQLVTKALNDPLLKWSPPGNTSDAYAANGLNQYTAITPDGGAAAAVVHDGNGNITTDHRGRGYVYDAENMLRQITGLASGTALYGYYADGTRYYKIYNGATGIFYYDGDQEVYERDGTGATVRRYIRLPGSVDEPLLMIDYTLNGACTTVVYSACEVWAHQNRLGSVVATTNSAGAVIEKYTYSPYGESGPEGDAGFPFRFTGQKLDADTGLYYYKARYYDPETGRFLQTDPIGYEDQMNLYAYVGNDPVNNFDPTGEYGRGSGFSDDEWNKFDSAQQQAAGRLERGADALGAAADELKAGGELSNSAQRTISSFQKATGKTATAKNLRQTSKKFSKGAKALRDDGSKGYVANAISKPSSSVFASVNRVGGKTMTVNVGHGRFNRSDGTLGRDGWALVGHESLHSAGLDDQKWRGNGMRAYRRGSKAGHRAAYRNLPPNQRIKNPDHLMSIVDP